MFAFAHIIHFGGTVAPASTRSWREKNYPLSIAMLASPNQPFAAVLLSDQ
jgi:hypothetical protein